MRFCVRSASVSRTVGVRPWFALVAVLGLLLAGCQNRDEIKQYTVKKLPHAERKVAETPQDGTIAIWGDGIQTRSFLYIDECLEGVNTIS